MKQFSLFINILLLLAVAYLFYHVFSNKSTQAIVKNNTNSTTTSHAAQTIAYVELDSLNEKINYIKNKRKDLEAEQKAIENNWRSNMEALQTKRDNFLKRGNSITQAEAEQFQGELIKSQESIENQKQAAASKLSEKTYKFMEDLQGKLKSFLKKYNEQKNYSYILTSGSSNDFLIYKDSTKNITDDIVKGMNEILKP